MSLKQLELLVLPTIENIDDIAKGINVNIVKAYYSSIHFCFKDGNVSILHNDRDIMTYDAVWLSSYWASRDLAYSCKLYLDSKSISNTYVEQTTSKLTDTMNFALNDISHPNSYYIENSELIDNIQTLESTCTYPMIMKDLKGCGGNNTEYIGNRDELILKFGKRKRSKKYMFQSYIANDYDWGVLVANGKVVSAERSFPKVGEFRNNVGATEVFTDVGVVPEEVKDMAIKASNILGLSWSRSDIIIEKGSEKPYLLEVNRFPGITGNSSEVFGANVFMTEYIHSLSS